jgi:hypothetical protein
MKKIIRLTENDLTRIIERVIQEQSVDHSCLKNAGFKFVEGGNAYNQIGKPMKFEGHYEGSYMGKMGRFLLNGNFSTNDEKQQGKWKCENNKVVVFDLKTYKFPKLPF